MLGCTCRVPLAQERDEVVVQNTVKRQFRNASIQEEDRFVIMPAGNLELPRPDVEKTYEGWCTCIGNMTRHASCSCTTVRLAF